MSYGCTPLISDQSLQQNPYTYPSQRMYVDQPIKLGKGQGQEVPMKDQRSKVKCLVSLGPDNSKIKHQISPKTPGAVTVSQAVDVTGDFRACKASSSTTDASTETDSTACLDQDTQTTAASRPTSVSHTVDASGDFRVYFTSAQECQAAPSTTVASTEMDSPAHLDQDSQTMQASTAEKTLITEAFMEDLNFLAKEFCRLKSVDEDLKLVKDNQLKPNTKCGCECSQRLKQAELKLLALQYTMCRDHCWRRYLTSAQGEQEMHCPNRVPDSLAETLQALEEMYSQMRKHVLSGAALDELTPLSVDTHRLNTEALYTPAQDALRKPVVSDAKQGIIERPKMKTLKADISHGSFRSGGCEEEIGVNSEAWFDAEEDLWLSDCCLKEERFRKGKESEKTTERGSKAQVKCAHTQQEDLLLEYEKYQPRKVCLTMSNKSRTANMTVSSPDTAEAAVRDLSGTSIHGKPLQVRHVSRPPAAVSEGDHTFKKPKAPSGPTAAPPGHVPKPGSVRNTTPSNMLPRPSASHIQKLLNISPVPTASGTWVPLQPPASTSPVGSFAWQKIMEAILKQRAPLNSLLHTTTREEGSLHTFILKHPALTVAEQTGIVQVKQEQGGAAEDMTSNLNKSRMPTFYGVSQCKKCGTSCPPGSDFCRVCFAPPPEVHERQYFTGEKAVTAAVPNSAREEWKVPSSSCAGVWDGSSNHGGPGDLVTQESFQSACDESHASVVSSPAPRYPQSQRFAKEWREGLSSVPSAGMSTSALTDTSAQASFSLDVELERHRKMAQGDISSLTHPVCQSDLKMVTDKSYLDLAQETPPEYYSFNSTVFDQTSAEWMLDSSQSIEQGSADSLMATRGSVEHTENSLTTSAFFPSEASVSCNSCPKGQTNFDTTADESLHREPREEFHSVMEESVNPVEPWLNCSSPQENLHVSPSHGPLVDVRMGVRSGLSTPRKESGAESFPVISSDKSGVQMPPAAAPQPTSVSQTVDASGDFRAYFTSAQECQATPRTTVASTEMDSPAHLDQDTQTMQAPTTDKSLITEIFMADLDFLSKEFLRLKSVEEELELLKAHQLKPKTKCGCECSQRLKQAELKLLALQYTMCRDHCWRRYLTSAQGEQEMHCPNRVPDSLAETLQALEEMYSQMRKHVLSGAALDELTPLSVDTHRLNTEALYTPAQHALSKAAVSHTKPEGAQSSKAVSLKTQRPHFARTGVCEEGGNITSEAWFDAEEDLGLAGQGMKGERLRKVMESQKSGAGKWVCGGLILTRWMSVCLNSGLLFCAVGDGECRKISSSCHLCITHLHEDVTEDDLLVLFEKYQPKEVCITMLNKIRTANMTVSSPDTAEAAVRDLSGTSIHGKPLQVRHVSRPPAAVSEGDHTFKKPKAPSGPTAAPPGHVPKPGSVRNATPYNMLPRPLRCNIEKLVNISSVPTATGTYVPPRPPTTSTGSFDTLMARLQERHPQVGRQRIVEALLELRAQHSDSLSGLPIRTIVEKASTLLTTQASASD
ncbi:hypothetical protein ACEWY4_023068 [Coilia grayii]|uniref:RRM domain-containing protein n=1 Tax=Coilia grayii TaxID=363190 RepID=A0ABD1J1Z2_9TELE